MRFLKLIKSSFFFILPILLTLVFAVTVGCSSNEEQKNYTGSKNYFEDINKVVLKTTDVENELERFKNDLSGYYDFSKKLFPVWEKNIGSSSELLVAFNNEKNIESKKYYAELLYKEYENFLKEIELIKSPEISKNAYDLAVRTLGKRKEYFQSYLNESLDSNEIQDIENEAYILEIGFWEEIDRIFNDFEKRAELLGLDNSSEPIMLLRK